ncbi:RsfA family transcriptional regulator [Bacillus suaedaesalsae]|uniref:RsfA family transcriptional regulator n=1 Tax=Bacillus suaedaesalsae TaxID=2810349 RepID=A0ABS2DJB3_9BACI|nr:RsfA family transcriptional regulator [Bacillus suaedaesalsae]MBM6618563.1 RsfA family transcriptional regulator [Bacillus suaedaesalsae]
MTTVRQDAWTQDEDLLLAEVVLKYIREGGTQLSAFEEVGRNLSRTSAACGFRWNSYVRKQYKQGIELAKQQRKELKKEGPTPKAHVVEDTHSNEENSLNSDDQLTLSDVIAYLRRYEQSEDTQGTLKEEYDHLKERVSSLEDENTRLKKEKKEVEKQLDLVKEDYKALMGIMDRARKMMMLQEEDPKNRQVKFQIERNGSLEKVEK